MKTSKCYLILSFTFCVDAKGLKASITTCYAVNLHREILEFNLYSLHCSVNY